MRSAPIDVKSAHITPSGGNVFADLGFDAKQAAQLQARSKKIIATKWAIKESLMAELADWMESHSLTQKDAAVLFGVTRPRVSDVKNKKTMKFTIDALVDMLARVGKRVHVSVN